MKYAILADIHANLAALQAVLEDSRQQSCSHFACLGDIVGYGSEPKECVDIIRQSATPCVRGNFEEYCGGDKTPDAFQTRLAENIRWHREQLTEDDRRWLRTLSLVQVVDGFTIVHAVLNSPSRWQYAFDKFAAAASPAKQTTSVCFFGHTHVPVAFVRDGMVCGGTYETINVKRGKMYFVNPGSVGQPRDGDRRASYATYNLNQNKIELRRADYKRGTGDDGGAAGAVGPSGGFSPKSDGTSVRLPDHEPTDRP